ncbi:hypothetical protein [Microbacterium sp. WHRI 7836]|uniref:hypothetical protein n=1 Tax=Microbacterium TaxID=33882 RepID=UPI0032EB4B51
MNAERVTSDVLVTIAPPGRWSKIRTDHAVPKMATPVFFAAGLVACDLITRAIAAQKG